MYILLVLLLWGDRYVFITFHNPQDAAMAKTQGQGHKIDKTHSFIINSFTDFHTLESVSDTYEPPQPVPFVPPVCFRLIFLSVLVHVTFFRHHYCTGCLTHDAVISSWSITAVDLSLIGGMASSGSSHTRSRFASFLFNNSHLVKIAI